MVHCLFQELLFGITSLGERAARDNAITNKFKHCQPLLDRLSIARGNRPCPKNAEVTQESVPRKAQDTLVLSRSFGASQPPKAWS
jgi:hypothetical protein